MSGLEVVVVGAAIPNVHLVRLKFDNNSPDIEFWSVRDNTGGAVMYTTEPLDLIAKIKKSEILLFEFTPIDEPTTTVTFHVAGLQDVLSKYPECAGSGTSEGQEDPHPSQDSSETPDTITRPTQPAQSTEPSNASQGQQQSAPDNTPQQPVQPATPQGQQPPAPIERLPPPAAQPNQNSVPQ